MTTGALFEIEKPITTIGIGVGVDSITANIRNSAVLTGNNLGQLGNIEVLPTEDKIISCNSAHITS